MKSPQTIVALTAATLLLVVLFVLNLAMGSVSIPLADVWAVLTGNVTGEASDTWRFIIIESRLPQAIMALMGGAALAVSGLLLQTTFRNPLAGPDVFGINSGAALAVAVVMLGMGGSLSAGSLSLAGYAAVLFSALVGALAVTALISALSAVVRSSTMLLIIGLMIGYLANSAITLLNFFATSEGVKSYTVWGMGSFGNVSLASIPVAAVVIGLFLLAALALVKPLNAFLLGELYAENLGYDTRKLRLLRSHRLHRFGHAPHRASLRHDRESSCSLALHDALGFGHRPAVQLALRPSHPERHDSPRSSHPTSWCPRHHLRAAEKEVV